MRFAPAPVAAGREDEMRSEVGGGVWKQWLCFWVGGFGSSRNVVYLGPEMEAVGDPAFVFLREHSCQAIILHPVALQTCLFKSNLLPHN